MLPSLLLPLAGGFLFVLVRGQRSQPRLIESLTAARPAAQPALWPPAPTVGQNLALSVGLLGMTTAGHLGVPLLRVLSTPGLLYLDLYFIRTAYVTWQTERQVGIAVNDAVLATGLFVTRQFGAQSLFATLLFSSHKLQSLAEENLADYLGDTTMATAAPSPQHSPQHSALVAADKAVWQSWIDRGALPLLTLSTLSMPTLGAKRALAVLLTNFGYDYRLTAPLSTLRYLKVAKAQGIWVRDGQVLDQLERVDLLVLDVDWDDQSIAALQTECGRQLIMLRDDSGEPNRNTRLAHLQAEARTVAYISNRLVTSQPAVAADLYIAITPTPTSDMFASAQVILSDNQPAQLQQLFKLSTSLANNQKRGLYFAFAPSLVNLSGIYLGHFGVITALLIDYVGMAAGMVNAMWRPQQFRENNEGSSDGTPGKHQ